MSSALKHMKRSHRSDRAHYAALHSMPYIAPNDAKQAAHNINRAFLRKAKKEG